MSEQSRFNPLDRFTGRADIYARCRPDYPAEAIDEIMARARLGPASLLVDVGSGTGISSRIFAARGVPVVGIEPNEEMRRKAEAEPAPHGAATVSYRAGRAEATGLADSVADVVLAAQAFHWFDREAALGEFYRILKPCGWVALVWNERDPSDPFTAAYGQVIRTAREAEAIEQSRARAGEALLTHPCFVAAECLTFRHAQVLDAEGLLGRAFSSSYVPREGPDAEAFAAALRDVFARFQHDGKAVLRYTTTLYLARRRDGSA